MHRFLQNLKTNTVAIAILVSFLSYSCATYYDHYTLTETVQTKVMMEALLEKATTPYSDNSTEINALQLQIDKMLLYERTKDKDPIMIQMWQLLNREESAFQQFFVTWKEQGTLGEVFLQEFTPQITKQLELMIDYESKKDKESASALSFIFQSAIN